MGTASDLLFASEETVFTIDSSLRTISIPPSVTNLGVESDDDVTRVYFAMPKVYGDIDLSTFNICIKYLNAKNESDLYHVTDSTVEGDQILFSWLVGGTAAAYQGNVTFNVRLTDVSDDGTVNREFNTTKVSLPILSGLAESGESYFVGGTTPTQTFTLPYDVSQISKLRVNYSQRDALILVKTESDVTLEGSTVVVQLTQEETLTFKPEVDVEIQLDILTNGGDLHKSKIKHMRVGRCLNSEVLK